MAVSAAQLQLPPSPTHPPTHPPTSVTVGCGGRRQLEQMIRPAELTAATAARQSIDETFKETYSKKRIHFQCHYFLIQCHYYQITLLLLLFVASFLLNSSQYFMLFTLITTIRIYLQHKYFIITSYYYICSCCHCSMLPQQCDLTLSYTDCNNVYIHASTFFW